MSIKLTQVQSDIIKDIALKNGFKNYEIIATCGSQKGDGFLGIIKSVTIKGDKGELNLILKSAHLSETLRKKTSIADVYRREIFLYEEVFPAFQEFQKEYNVSDGFSAYTKLYGRSLDKFSECVILENLKEINYKLWNKRVPMDTEHLTSVIVEYGKLHATSLAMRSRKPEVYNQLTDKLQNMYTPEGDNTLWGRVAEHVAQAGEKAVEGNDLASAAIKKVTDNSNNFYCDAFSVPEDRLVILHGDCWNNNVMFYYGESQNNDTTKPERVCLLDWQLSRPGSPVVDLSYFMFVCASKEDLGQYRKYLRIYHDTLAEELTKFSCDVETIFPYKLLEAHWKKYCKFGVFMAIMLIKIMLSEEEEYPDIEILAKEEWKKTSWEFNHAEEYNKRIIDIGIILSENELV